LSNDPPHRRGRSPIRRPEVLDEIAQVAPLIERCPPQLYGGAERSVEPCSPKALRLDSRVQDPMPHHIAMLGRVRRRANEFDILHFQIDILAFLGRISQEKRPDRAIEIASRAGMRLKIAAKVDKVDEDYWRSTIKPMIAAHPGVEFIGEIADRQKADFLGNATALLFPIDWPEPFGIVMIKAMACGTPVIAFRRGAAPEVIADGVSGFFVDSVAEAVEAAKRIWTIDRADGRRFFEERFTVQRMAEDYLEIYRALLGARTDGLHLRRAAGHGLHVVA
jgi:glycosyltransferase involved in cell wall biosynthesis